MLKRLWSFLFPPKPEPRKPDMTPKRELCGCDWRTCPFGVECFKILQCSYDCYKQQKEADSD